MTKKDLQTRLRGVQRDLARVLENVRQGPEKLPVLEMRRQVHEVKAELDQVWAELHDAPDGEERTTECEST